MNAKLRDRVEWLSTAAVGLLLVACSGASEGFGEGELSTSTQQPLLTGPGLTFAGIVSPSNPPDTSGEVGPAHFVQGTNFVGDPMFQVWDKAGNVTAGPAQIESLFPAGNCNGVFCTDMLVNYDELADRWLLSTLPTAGTDAVCLAVSRTGTPTANAADWFTYEIRTPSFPDYQKIGVWLDAYYMTTFEGSSLGVYALDRAALIAGTAPSLITCAASGSQCLRDELPLATTRALPADVDGDPPPAGSPGLFARTIAGGQQDPDNTTDRIQIFEAAVNWGTQTWTVTPAAELPTQPFEIMECGGTRACVPQSDGTAVDALSDRPMVALRYRQFPDHASMVVTQTVNVQDLFPTATIEVAGKRWYELRDAGGGWTIQDQGDFAPQNMPADDSEFVHRWMGSAAMDGSGNIALGYNAVNSDPDPAETLNPSMFFAGRLTTDAPGTLSGETLIVESAAPAAVSGNRWGDYSMLSVDPSDDCTFWYTAHVSGGETFVANFRFDECGVAPVCVLGESTVDLRDRATVTAALAAGTFLQIGAPATLNGDGLVGGNALIRSNGVVNGDLTLAGTLSTQGPFTITGTLTQNASPAIPTLTTKTFATGSGFQEINSNVTLTPGNFGNVVIRPGRTVTLNAGVYNFLSLNVETDVNLVVNGAVEINVQGNFQFGDRSDVIGGAALTVYSNGSLVRIGTDATFNGVLSAPNANVTVSSRTDILGCVGGQNVTFDTDVTLDAAGRTLPTGAPASPTCSDGIQNGDETGVDCGGSCPACPTGTVSATRQITSDWGSGYCATLFVTNQSPTLSTTNWSVSLNLNGSNIYTSWNGTFSGSAGAITVVPSFDWNRSILPLATNDSVGFCANRPPGAGTAVVTGASGSF